MLFQLLKQDDLEPQTQAQIESLHFSKLASECQTEAVIPLYMTLRHTVWGGNGPGYPWRMVRAWGLNTLSIVHLAWF